MRSVTAIRPGRLTRVVLCAAALLLAACEGGGTGPGPEPQNPAPAISQLDPGTLLQWSDSTTVTVMGNGFIDGSVVRLNGSARPTTYASPTQLTAVIPVSQMQQAGTLQITVFNPAPGGGESSAASLPVNHRVPDVLSLEPAGVMQGSAPLTLAIYGVGFAQGAVVRWNGAARPTTFVNLGEVHAQIPATDFEQPGPAQVTVFNPAPGGGTSLPRVFTVAERPNPVPAITELDPATLTAEVGGEVRIIGSSFMPGSQVSVGGFTPTPTFVSATELRITLNGSNVPNAGMASVQVTNPAPGGGLSNPATLMVQNPVPVVSAVAPATADIGEDSVVVRVTGTGFVAATSVLVNNVLFPTRRTQPGELQATLKAADLDQVGNVAVRALNQAPGGGASNAVTLALVNPAPQVQSISPAQSLAGADSLVVRVTGSGFVPATVVRLQGDARTTRYVSRTQLDVVLAAADLTEAGTFALTAHNGTPAGGTSAPATLTLVAPVPVLTDIPSNGASAGRAGFVLTVHGSGFIRTSVIRWNGQERETRFISGTRLEADVATADLASPGTASITVHTPGGGTTAAQQMTVRPVGATTITGQVSLPVQARDLAYEPASNRLYASVPSTADAHADMVLAIDPLTGVVVDSVLVGGSPGKLALSDDGSTLWVALDATGQVRRISLPSLALAGSFSLGANRVWDMRVMPGRPGTVAISRFDPCCSPAHAGVAIYDDGIKRPRETPGHTGAELIAFGESASVIYGMYQAGALFTLRVDDTGVQTVRQTGVQRTGWRLDYANGRVYTGAGGVMDAARHQTVGVLPVGANAVVADATLGRLFAAGEFTGTLEVYDMNNFQLLGETSTGIQSVFRILRWGSSGLALLNDNGITLLRTPIAGP